MTTPSDELRQKLQALASYADELDGWLANPPDPSRPGALHRIVERMVQVIVECGADAGDLWLAEHNHPLGDSARGVFRRLKEVGVITLDLEGRFDTYCRTRNRIVHDYDRLDAVQIVEQARQLTPDVRALLRALTAAAP